MKLILTSCVLAGALTGVMAPLQAQQRAVSVATPALRPSPTGLRHAFTVDPNGPGADFQSLGVAAATVPSGSLLFLKGGVHVGPVNVAGKSLRIEAEVVGSTWLADRLVVQGVEGADEVSVSGLAFLAGLEVDACTGDVGFTNCSSSLEGDAALPPDVTFNNFQVCGIGVALNEVTACESVTFVGCTLAGRHGYFDGWDGTPGEHGLRVTDSNVTLYGSTLRGGNGGSSNALHGFAGAGGDGAQVRGSLTELRHCGTHFSGGVGGESQSWHFTACHGLPLAEADGASHFECGANHISLSVPSFVRAGVAPTYEITAPPGTPIFLMVSPRRDYRHFPADLGVLHLGLPISAHPLGMMPALGSFERPFPAPQPSWSGDFGSLEIQAYARIKGQDYYSEPRSLVVVPPGL